MAATPRSTKQPWPEAHKKLNALCYFCQNDRQIGPDESILYAYNGSALVDFVAKKAENSFDASTLSRTKSEASATNEFLNSLAEAFGLVSGQWLRNCTYEELCVALGRPAAPELRLVHAATKEDYDRDSGAHFALDVEPAGQMGGMEVMLVFSIQPIFAAAEPDSGVEEYTLTFPEVRIAFDGPDAFKLDVPKDQKKQDGTEDHKFTVAARGADTRPLFVAARFDGNAFDGRYELNSPLGTVTGLTEDDAVTATLTIPVRSCKLEEPDGSDISPNQRALIRRILEKQAIGEAKVVEANDALPHAYRLTAQTLVATKEGQ